VKNPFKNLNFTYILKKMKKNAKKLNFFEKKVEKEVENA
jgi:hypothetical protein